jgi:hypothetical protein
MSTKYDSITSGEVLLESRRPDSDKHEWEEADSSSMIYGTAEGLTANSSHTPHSSTHSLSVEDNHAVVTSDSQSREEVPRSSSPLPENVKPGIPESGEFLLEDPEDPLSDDEDPQLPPPSSGIQTLLTSESAAQAEEVPLTHPLASHPIPLPSPNVNKAIPPPPPSESDDEALEVFLPGLILPTMFLPIPNVRRSFSFQLIWWLPRHLMYSSRNLD